MHVKPYLPVLTNSQLNYACKTLSPHANKLSVESQDLTHSRLSTAVVFVKKLHGLAGKSIVTNALVSCFLCLETLIVAYRCLLQARKGVTRTYRIRKV